MEPEKTKGQSFWEIARFVLIAFVIVVPLRTFVVAPFVVSGSSMVPAFENKNYLIVDKISYRLSEPERNDVVVFRYPKDPTKFFIKRIVGLPNETVDIQGSAVTIRNGEKKEGFTLDEPYVRNTSNNNLHFELKDDEYFVMGDNRSGSSDSRVWGPVKKNLLTGKVFARLLPINKIEILPGNFNE